MTMQETQLQPIEERYSVALDPVHPWASPTTLNRFDLLDGDERMRIIIRLLCGLVAMEESTPSITDGHPVGAPTPGPSRRLPFLGIGAPAPAPASGRQRARGWNTALLPHLGRERPF